MAVVRHRRWLIGSGALALLLFSPVMALLIEAFSADAGLLQQLWQTVLPTYLFNSLSLVALVVLFAVLLGLPCGWLLANYQLPGHRYLEWALILPLAMPAYVVAYIYTDLLDYTGWLQIQLRGLFGWQSAADCLTECHSLSERFVAGDGSSFPAGSEAPPLRSGKPKVVPLMADCHSQAMHR